MIDRPVPPVPPQPGHHAARRSASPSLAAQVGFDVPQPAHAGDHRADGRVCEDEAAAPAPAASCRPGTQRPQPRRRARAVSPQLLGREIEVAPVARPATSCRAVSVPVRLPSSNGTRAMTAMSRSRHSGTARPPVPGRRCCRRPARCRRARCRAPAARWPAASG